MDKKLIAERFAKARNTYTREARVQQQVAEKMMQLLIKTMLSDNTSPAELSTRFQHITELGCGTGSYSRILLHTLQPATILLNDLCKEMEECVRELCTPISDAPHNTEASDTPFVRFLAGDAEAIDFQEGTDLITSCSTLQWFNDPAAFFARCHRSLSTGGMLAFSTFGAENMHQIRRLAGHGLEYLPIEELKTLLSPSFDILYAEEEIVPLSFSTPQQVLKHLKETGVTGTEKRIWTRGRLQAFCDEYIRLFGSKDGNVTLTYHPIYIIAKKKPNQVLV